MNQDLISRQEAKVALRKLKKWYVVCEEHTKKNMGFRYDDVMFTLDKLPSVQPERMTNRQWVDFLSAQFDISRTSAKEMLHGMMRWAKEDNFKKMFYGWREEMIITIDYGPDQEPEVIKNVTSVEFTTEGIFIFYSTPFGVTTEFFDYNSYVTMTIH